jgi:hypothetical protein
MQPNFETGIAVVYHSSDYESYCFLGFDAM